MASRQRPTAHPATRGAARIVSTPQPRDVGVRTAPSGPAAYVLAIESAVAAAGHLARRRAIAPATAVRLAMALAALDCATERLWPPLNREGASVGVAGGGNKRLRPPRRASMADALDAD